MYVSGGDACGTFAVLSCKVRFRGASVTRLADLDFGVACRPNLSSSDTTPSIVFSLQQSNSVAETMISRRKI